MIIILFYWHQWRFLFSGHASLMFSFLMLLIILFLEITIDGNSSLHVCIWIALIANKDWFASKNTTQWQKYVTCIIYFNILTTNSIFVSLHSLNYSGIKNIIGWIVGAIREKVSCHVFSLGSLCKDVNSAIQILNVYQMSYFPDSWWLMRSFYLC